MCEEFLVFNFYVFPTVVLPLIYMFGSGYTTEHNDFYSCFGFALMLACARSIFI